MAEPIELDEPPPPLEPAPKLLVEDLAPRHTPTLGLSKRLIIVGDVHGHLAPLKRLLRRVGFRPANAAMRALFEDERHLSSASTVAPSPIGEEALKRVPDYPTGISGDGGQDPEIPDAENSVTCTFPCCARAFPSEDIMKMHLAQHYIAEMKDRVDHLIFTGDLINKGPSSGAVVDLAMALNASCVRGNHENHVLELHAQYLAGRGLPRDRDVWELAKERLPFVVNYTPSKVQDIFEEEKEKGKILTAGEITALKTAEALTDEQLRWLDSHPLMLRVSFPPTVSHIHGGRTLLIAHAGLVPQLPPEMQLRKDVMHMRSLSYDSDKITLLRAQKDAKDALGFTLMLDRVPQLPAAHHPYIVRRVRETKEAGLEEPVYIPKALEGREGVPWDEEYNKCMREKPGEQRTVVVYGHDARRGLQVGHLRAEYYGRDGGVAQDAPTMEHDMDMGGSVMVGEDDEPGRWTYGLDSGAIYGKGLSALVIEVGPDGFLKMKVVQVWSEKVVEPKE